MIQLRPYQEKLLSDVRESFKKGHRRVLAVLPCGGGKTVIFAQMASLAKTKHRNVLFLVHRRELVKQTLDTFVKFEIPSVTISTVQSFVKRLKSCPNYDLIIFDEAHHSTSGTWRKIIDHFKDAYIVGLTATPCRLDGKPLGEIYTDMVVGASAEQLTELGFLCDYKYFAPTLADMSKLKKRGSDYDMDDAFKVLDKPKIYGDVVSTYKSIANGLKTICYCPNILFSKRIAASFRDAGISAVHFDASTPNAVRDGYIEAFRRGELSVLCNVDLISEGFDVPDCQAVILLRPTQSTALYIQQASRGLRPAEGKQAAVIIDHVSNYFRHGFPTDTKAWSLEAVIKPVSNSDSTGNFIIRVCESCFRTFQSASVCPFCGAEYHLTEREIQQVESVRLKEISRLEAEREKQRMEAYRYHVRGKVMQYRSYKQCLNRMELSEFCKLQGYSHKKFIFLAMQLGFFRKR